MVIDESLEEKLGQDPFRPDGPFEQLRSLLVLSTKFPQAPGRNVLSILVQPPNPGELSYHTCG